MAVQSVERAFTLLRLIAETPQGIGVSDLARHTNLHKSTVSRLVATLEEAQVVERLPRNAGFRIGSGLMSLVAASPFPQNLINLARPVLCRLAEITQETVGLCVPDGDVAYYVDQVESAHHLRVQDWTGRRYPLHVVGSGRFFLGVMPPEQREAYLSRPLEARTPNTLTNPAALQQAIAQAQQQGYVWAFEEFEEGLVSVAGPVQDKSDTVVASIYVGGPRFRFPPAGAQERITRQLVAACRQVSALLRAAEFELRRPDGNGF